MRRAFQRNARTLARRAVETFERSFERASAVLMPQLAGAAPWDGIWLMAVPKKRITYTRKRIRSGKRDKLDNDHSITTCKKCGGFKKKHVLLHCPSSAENCGFPNDTYIVRMPFAEKPKWIKTVTSQRHGIPWNGKHSIEEVVVASGTEEQRKEEES